MNVDNDNNNEEKHMNRIFELFKDKSKTFERAFGISMGFYLLFFFLIFIPYISLLNNYNEKIEEIGPINKKIEEYDNASHALQMFQINLNNFPNEIVEFIRPLFLFEGQNYAKCSIPWIFSPLLFQTKGESKDIILSLLNDTNTKNILKSCIKVKFTTSVREGYKPEKEFGIHFYNGSIPKSVNDDRFYPASVSYPPNQTRFSPLLNASAISFLPYYDCGIFPSSNHDIACNVKENTIDFIKQFNRTLNVLQYDNLFKKSNTLLNFQKDLRELPGDYEWIFLKTLNQMLSSGGITNDDERFNNLKPILQENVNNRFLNLSSFLILNHTLTERLNQLQINKSRLEQNLTEIEKHQDKIASQLNEIASPIVKLLTGLSESISLFPLALSIGFLVYSFLLAGTIRLRSEFHQWYKTLKKNVTVVAPLWIDPIKIKESKSIFQLHWEISKIIVYFIPIVIFGITLFVILDIRESINYTYNDNLLFYNKENILQMFNILYIIATGLIGYGSLILLIEIRNYTKSINRI